MNIFRLLGDLSHLLSKIILITTIHTRRSAEGISLLTQILYLVVFITRYLDLLNSSAYHTVFKTFYLLSSGYILWIMLGVFKRTREEEREWKVAAVLAGGSAVLAPLVWLTWRKGNWFVETCWTFSIILESVAVLPQLSLLRHTAIPTAITSYYLLALGLYRALYIPNWIMRELDKTEKPDRYWRPVSFVFGVVQTILYVEFAWIYWRRQKVKIRDNGAVLDGDDFLSGGLVLRWIGKVAGGPTSGRTTGGGWRGGGISVSADDVESGELVAEEFGDSDDEDSGSEDLEVEVADGVDSGAR